MLEILNAEQTRKAEELAIAAGTTGFSLMNAAGAAVAAEVLRCIDPVATLVLCGPGQNGGDGFIIARELHKAGWPVRVACAVPKKQLKGDAALAAKEWEGTIESLNSNLSVHQTGLVIDAIFGTGFKGAFEPELKILLDKIRTRKIAVVAVDLPSGINADSGSIADGTLDASLTVTFTRQKPAHVLSAARKICGRTIIADIGISDEHVAQIGAIVFENHPGLWAANFPVPDADSHKYTRGMAVIYGGEHLPGAACLVAAAAQRAGAGAVKIAAPPTLWPLYAAYRASIMVESTADIDAFKNTLRDERVRAVAIGSGGGIGEKLKEATLAALSFPQKTVVLDGDVFSTFRDDTAAFFEKLTPQHILTPHEGEFARIFPDITGSKLNRARKAAKACGAIVVLKGSDTIIAAPDGGAVVQTSSPPTLATAGSGDVLAGLICGLAAQGMPPMMAAAAGVWLHGQSAAKYGLGLTAEDIISLLPQALNDLFGLFPDNQIKF